MSFETLPTSKQTFAVFLDLEARLLEAFQRRNIDEIAKLVDDRCIGIGVHGKEYTKSDFLKDLYASVTVTSYDLVSVSAVEEDTFAVVLANWEVDMKLDQAIIRGRMRGTRTWVKRPDGWKMICFHLTDARLANAWENLTKPSL